jgi:hypothetical protein
VPAILKIADLSQRKIKASWSISEASHLGHNRAFNMLSAVRLLAATNGLCEAGVKEENFSDKLTFLLKKQ